MKIILTYVIAVGLLVSYIILAPANLKLLSGAFCTGVCVRLLIDKFLDD